MATNSTKKTTEDLNLTNLQRRFFIGERMDDDGNGKLITKKVNLLKYALEDGSFLALVNQCANDMHNGDVRPVYAALKRNIQSKQSHLRKEKIDGTYNPRSPYETEFCTMLDEFIDKQLNALPEKSEDPMFAVTNGLARWKLSIADIDKFDKSDVETFRSIYNNMATAKSRMVDQIVEHYWTEVKKDAKGLAKDKQLVSEDRKDEAEAVRDFQVRYAYVSKLKSAAEKSAKNPKPEVKVSDSLKAKLAKGGKATLSADEALELAELLKKFQQ